jgi:hypothetical protein
VVGVEPTLQRNTILSRARLPIPPHRHNNIFKGNAEDRNRTGTVVTYRRILSPVRLPVPPPRRNEKRYKTKIKYLKAATGFEPVVKVLQTSALPLGYAAICDGAEDGIRTRDPHLGKVVFYH